MLPCYRSPLAAAPVGGAQGGSSLQPDDGTTTIGLGVAPVYRPSLEGSPAQPQCCESPDEAKGDI